MPEASRRYQPKKNIKTAAIVIRRDSIFPVIGSSIGPTEAAKTVLAPDETEEELPQFPLQPPDGLVDGGGGGLTGGGGFSPSHPQAILIKSAFIGPFSIIVV